MELFNRIEEICTAFIAVFVLLSTIAVGFSLYILIIEPKYIDRCETFLKLSFLAFGLACLVCTLNLGNALILFVVTIIALSVLLYALSRLFDKLGDKLEKWLNG